MEWGPVSGGLDRHMPLCMHPPDTDGREYVDVASLPTFPELVASVQRSILEAQLELISAEWVAGTGPVRSDKAAEMANAVQLLRQAREALGRALP